MKTFIEIALEFITRVATENPTRLGIGRIEALKTLDAMKAAPNLADDEELVDLCYAADITADNVDGILRAVDAYLRKKAGIG